MVVGSAKQRHYSRGKRPKRASCKEKHGPEHKSLRAVASSAGSLDLDDHRVAQQRAISAGGGGRHAEPFAHLHEELAAEGARKGLVFHCKEGNRIGLSPLGVVIAEALPRCLSVRAFHTFPDELAVLKTQSLFELLDE